MASSNVSPPAQNGDTASDPTGHADHNPVDEVIVTQKLEVTRVKGSDKKVVNQYEFEKCLGRGQHGQVWVAKDLKNDEQRVAIKTLKRKDKKADKMNALRKRNLPSSPHLPLTSKLSETEMKILKEVAIMKKLRHPHVVRLLEVMDDHLVKDIYLVMEYCAGGEVKWRTTDNQPILRVSQTRRIVRDVILGLEYLHYQGIIHRDIKPANLFWSEDRRTVKIGDFGVSHFSMAQRIAEAGEDASTTKEDPILMDESDLSKFAGTPMFLAPEVVADPSSDVSTNATNTITSFDNSDDPGTSTPRRRPTITKAIDVWALGVTIFGLLFGKLPFNGENEFAIYRSIREDDWVVPDAMGSDHIPTGGRNQPKPKKGKETEGYHLVLLLEGLLQKDPKKRLTLEQTKKHPWILRDMSHPDLWLRTTQIGNTLGATDAEASSALSFVRFRWPDISKGLSSLLRGVRPQRSFRQQPDKLERGRKGKERERDDVGTRSMPVVSLSRQKSIAIGVHERDKQKQHSVHRSAHQSSVDVSGSPWRHSSHHSKSSGPAPSGSGLKAETLEHKPRRGSASGHNASKLDVLVVPTPSSRIGSPQPRHTMSRQPSQSLQATAPSSPTYSELDERARNRFSMSASAMYRWMTGKSGPPSQNASTSALPSGATSPVAAPHAPQGQRILTVNRDLTLRRSVDALHQASSRKSSSSSSGPLTLAMRAASWGEGNYRPSEDMQSIYSAERNEETLDDDTRFVGAGGYAQSPVPSVPSGVLSTVSSTASIGQPAWNTAQALLHRSSDGPPTPTESRCHTRSHTTSPLARGPRHEYGRSRTRLSQSSDDYDDDDDDDESILSVERAHSALDYTELQPNTSQMYHEEDDESDEEAVPLEVRTTRRPSVSVTSASPSPPPRSSSDCSRGRTRPTICI